MPQYVIIAHDDTDENALDRRMNARPAHLDGARTLKATNNFIIGGAILNENQQMKGSVMIMNFDNEDQFKEWMKNEPYIVNNVWKDISIHPFRVADV